MLGLTTIQDELAELLNEHDPDVVVLTETKLVEQQHAQRWISQNVFGGTYTLHCSSSLASKRRKNRWNNYQCGDKGEGTMEEHSSGAQAPQQRSGAGGVILALHNRWAIGSNVARRPYNNMEYMRGHAVEISVQPPSCQSLHIAGVYMPFDSNKRDLIYAALAREPEDKDLAIAAGDWNATLLPSDKGHETNTAGSGPDEQHQKFVTNAKLHHLRWQDTTHRPHTFMSHANPQCSSRIDDILVSSSLACRSC